MDKRNSKETLLKAIQYLDKKVEEVYSAGVVEFLTEFVDVIDINESLEGRMMRPLATIGNKK